MMVFYTQLFTSKREALAKIWLAAHWERKLTKAHVFDCNLESTVRDIISTKINIGLRTSGHLLVGVVRIYSRKTKYLLADCNDAIVQIKVSFRPGHTDLPVEGLEAAIKSITLPEDFTDFDAQLPHPNEIGAVDHFSLNQSRTEDITLKEDFGNDFLNLVDFGDESQCHRRGILGTHLTHGDSFGDENTGYVLLDFMTNFSGDTESMDFLTEVPQSEMPETPLKNIQPIGFPDNTTSDPTEAEHDVLSETTLLANEEEGFALEPVAVTSTTERKRGKRKRRLVVDQTKELSNQDIKEQLVDSSGLLGPPDMAPPTAQLMQWKDNGGALRLFGRFSSTAISSQLQQLFTKSILGLESDEAAEEGDPELTRNDKQEVEENASVLSTDTKGLGAELVDPEVTVEEVEPLDNTNSCSDATTKDNILEFSLPQLPSEEDSMLVHPTGSVIHTQSMLGSQDEEDNRMAKRVLKVLYKLKAQSTETFSLQALCEGCTRSHVATTFFCLLVLKKEQALDLQQATPYGDITATPGPRFYHSVL